MFHFRFWNTSKRFGFVSILSFDIGPPVLSFRSVFRIRIHRIHMFLGLLDPDPLVRGMDPDLDPDPNPSVSKQK